jgi:hypothetical protein
MPSTDPPSVQARPWHSRTPPRGRCIRPVPGDNMSEREVLYAGGVTKARVRKHGMNRTPCPSAPVETHPVPPRRAVQDGRAGTPNCGHADPGRECARTSACPDERIAAW